MFRVGQKVVCVCESKDWKRAFHQRYDFPKIGNVYTIRTIGPGYKSRPGGIAVRLVEINNPLALCGEEPNFLAWRFRPIVERKTDISIFTRMLTPKREDA